MRLVYGAGDGICVEADLGVEVGRPGGVADARRAVRDALDVDVRGQVELHEHAVDLRERAAERVADLSVSYRAQSHAADTISNLNDVRG